VKFDTPIELNASDGDCDEGNDGDEESQASENGFDHAPKGRRGALSSCGRGLFTGVDNPVENYIDVINKEVYGVELAPACGE
jgi:hypothetical protein